MIVIHSIKAVPGKKYFKKKLSEHPKEEREGGGVAYLEIYLQSENLSHTTSPG